MGRWARRSKGKGGGVAEGTRWQDSSAPNCAQHRLVVEFRARAWLCGTGDIVSLLAVRGLVSCREMGSAWRSHVRNNVGKKRAAQKRATTPPPTPARPCQKSRPQIARAQMRRSGAEQVKGRKAGTHTRSSACRQRAAGRRCSVQLLDARPGKEQNAGGMRWHERLTHRSLVSAKLNALSLSLMMMMMSTPRHVHVHVHHHHHHHHQRTAGLAGHLTDDNDDDDDDDDSVPPLLPPLPARHVRFVARGLRAAAALPNHGFPGQRHPLNLDCFSCRLVMPYDASLHAVSDERRPPSAPGLRRHFLVVPSDRACSRQAMCRKAGQPFGADELVAFKRPSCVAATGTWCLAKARWPAKKM
ncbi:hypothetical protein CERZMDRAFT_86671 [Cercospora zeae-maydis SCOH1-5]|uniref:Uncharacterized protein n=1 Tax=Cercospora zeae-maydis SCOH1-5 TaxID=717836 RepID=A0A6A6F820_9PEZI|nr:hypothetical protein CERZMDRAFT_86671 [Cercospora zeae-maydis SCOH1-5]